VNRAPTQGAVDLDRVLAAMRETSSDWQGMLRQDTRQAHRALQALLAGRLVFTPRVRGADRSHTFEGPGNAFARHRWRI
jgi:hypothetical protein